MAMNNDNRKQALRTNSRRIHCGIDLDDVALQIEQSRILAADMKRLVLELERCVAMVEARLRDRRRALLLHFSRRN